MMAGKCIYSELLKLIHDKLSVSFPSEDGLGEAYIACIIEGVMIRLLQYIFARSYHTAGFCSQTFIVANDLLS